MSKLSFLMILNSIQNLTSLKRFSKFTFLLQFAFNCDTYTVMNGKNENEMLNSGRETDL